MIPADPNRFRLFAIRVGLPLLLLFAAAGGAWFFRDQWKQPVLDWRANGLVQESADLGQAGDWKTAEMRALAAHQLAPSLLGPRQALFEAATAVNSRYLLPAAHLLFTHPEASTETRIEVLEAILRAGQPALFVFLHQKLDLPTRSRDEVVLLLADFLAQTGNAAQARGVLEDRLRRHPDRRFTAKLARVLLLPGWNDAERTRAHELLAELGSARDVDSCFRDALAALAPLPLELIQPSLLPPATADWLEALPDATVDDHLLATRLRLAALPPAEREPLLTATVQRFQTSAPESLAQWLFGLGRADLVLGLIDEIRGQASPSLFGLRLRAVQTVRGPEAALAWMDQAPPDVNPTDLLLGKAACLFQLDRRADALGTWDEILHQAEVDPSRTPVAKLYLNAMAQQQLDIAARILLSECRRPGTALPPSGVLVPVMAHLTRSGRLEDLRFLTETLLRREEGNPVLQNNFAYLCFLFDQNRETALGIADGLVEAHPKALPFRTTLAFGHLVDGQPGEAVKVLSSPDLDWSLAGPADHAIRAAALERTGRTAEAAEERKQFDPAQLSDEERKLLVRK
jgi:hypothetical protein